MTPLVRRYIKTSFVFLLAGLLIGAYIVVGEFLLGAYPPRLHVTAHAHLLLVGFLLMVVMGVATWMFPRPARDDARYRPALAETVYWIMTLATSVRALAELGAPFVPGPAPRILIVAGGLGQLVATGLFVVNMWSRVRMPVVTAGVILAASWQVAGCAPLTPEARLQREVMDEVYWDAAKECEGHFRNVLLDRVQPNGDLSVSAAAETRLDRGPFTRCYHEGIARRIEHRRREGKVVPENPNLEPEVDFD